MDCVKISGSSAEFSRSLGLLLQNNLWHELEESQEHQRKKNGGFWKLWLRSNISCAVAKWSSEYKHSPFFRNATADFCHTGAERNLPKYNLGPIFQHTGSLRWGWELPAVEVPDLSLMGGKPSETGLDKQIATAMAGAGGISDHCVLWFRMMQWKVLLSRDWDRSGQISKKH